MSATYLNHHQNDNSWALHDSPKEMPTERPAVETWDMSMQTGNSIVNPTLEPYPATMFSKFAKYIELYE